MNVPFEIVKGENGEFELFHMTPEYARYVCVDCLRPEHRTEAAKAFDADIDAELGRQGMMLLGWHLKRRDFKRWLCKYVGHFDTREAALCAAQCE